MLEVRKRAKLDAERQAAERVKAMAEEQRLERACMQRESSQALQQAQTGEDASPRKPGCCSIARGCVSCEEEARRQLKLEQERADAEAERFRGEVSTLHWKQRRKESEVKKALQDMEAKVLRLGGLAAARAQEAALHAHREEEVRRELEQQKESAEAEAERMRAEAATFFELSMRAPSVSRGGL